MCQKEVKKQVTVGSIFNQYGAAYIHENKPSTEACKMIHLLGACGTSAMDSHNRSCDKCGHAEIAYNTCRNRHCPGCQALEGLEWFEKRKKELLPTNYYHMVFTIPNQLNNIRPQ